MTRIAWLVILVLTSLTLQASPSLNATWVSPETLPMKTEWTYVQSATQVEALSEINTHVRAEFLPGSAIGLFKKCPWITHLDLRNRWAVDWDGMPFEKSKGDDSWDKIEASKGYGTEDMQGIGEIGSLQSSGDS